MAQGTAGPGRKGTAHRGRLSACVLSALAAVAWVSACSTTPATPESRPEPVGVTRQNVAQMVRLAGTVEAVRAFSVNAPRLTGRTSNTPLVITRLVAGGTRVEAGDVLVEFDPQGQQRAARDQRSALLDLEGQIRKLDAQQEAARATDEAELTRAANDVARARLDVQTNPFVPRIEAETNDLAVEQAVAKLDQLERTFGLKRAAAAAALRILEIQRDRARSDADHAERNRDLMTVTAPFDGLVVIDTIFRGSGQMTEVQEGDEVRSGVGILDVVDPSSMQVRASVNQVDITHVAAGQAVRIRLDAYPDLAFDGQVEQLAPLAVPSQLTSKVRTFVAMVSIAGSHERLMPDLSASVDIPRSPRSPDSSTALPPVEPREPNGAHRAAQ